MAIDVTRTDREVRKLREEAKARVLTELESLCGFPTPQTEPQYLGAGKPDPWVKRNS
ncbi:hypothetical protein SPFM1_00088 [Salmonella phage SPFM1]|nr:hypothetical protein SPFM1_00088 [Salmonella phage SPFM1]